MFKAKKTIEKLKQIYEIALFKHEREIIQTVLRSNRFGQICINDPPTHIHRIGIIIFSINKYAGGTTSILRLATGLTDLGYCVSYINYGEQGEKELKTNASFNLPGYKGIIKKSIECSENDFDVVIATSWLAAYRLNDYMAYKMYFVQDYEPYFFKVNERYLLAKLTYELGYHIVSLGQWNIHQIQRECKCLNSRLDFIDFPYERTEYVDCGRDYSVYQNKNSFSMAVYIKEEGKRIPNIVQYILLNASLELKKRGIDLIVNFFGLSSGVRTIVGNNLGKLNREELQNLYQNSDFGMVASMTNISLVPYEMISTGLPIIEMEAGSFPDFFGKECAILIDYNFQTFINKFMELINQPEELSQMVKKAQKKINGLSWEKSCRQFASIMEGTIKRNY